MEPAPVTPQAQQREVPGAGSPLTGALLNGPPRQALVLASFPTALYLLVGDHHEVLPVLASDALMLPTGVRLNAPGRDLVWGVEPGERVTVGWSGIQLERWRVEVVREWRPARVSRLGHAAEPAELAEVVDALSAEVNSSDLMNQATAVCRAARSGDDAEVRRRTGLLLGAGAGLTPSGDDVLCAVLLLLCGVGDPAPITLLGNAVQDRWAATTSLSASLLDSARKGYGVPEVVTLVECAVRGDLAGTHAALTPTMAIGHTSGRDLVAGLAGSLRALTPELSDPRRAMTQRESDNSGWEAPDPETPCPAAPTLVQTSGRGSS